MAAIPQRGGGGAAAVAVAAADAAEDDTQPEEATEPPAGVFYSGSDVARGVRPHAPPPSPPPPPPPMGPPAAPQRANEFRPNGGHVFVIQIAQTDDAAVQAKPAGAAEAARKHDRPLTPPLPAAAYTVYSSWSAK